MPQMGMEPGGDAVTAGAVPRYKVGQTVYLTATVTAVNADGTAKQVALKKSATGGYYVNAVYPDQSTTEVLD